MSSKPRMPPLVWSNQQDPGIVLSCRELQKFGTIQIIYMRNHIYTDYAIQFTAVYSIWFGMIWYDLVFETYRVRMSTGASTLHSSIINWITLAFARIATQFCRIVVLSCFVRGWVPDAPNVFSLFSWRLLHRSSLHGSVCPTWFLVRRDMSEVCQDKCQIWCQDKCRGTK